MFKDIVSLRLSVLQMSINTNAAIFPLYIVVVLRLLIQFLLLTNLRVILSCGPDILPLCCQRLDLVNTSDKAYSTRDSTDRISRDCPVQGLPVPSPSGAEVGDMVHWRRSGLIVLNFTDPAYTPDCLSLGNVRELAH